MTIYKDVNGREFTYNEYWNKIYLDEKRPHVDHLIRHKWPEERPKEGWYLVWTKDYEHVVAFYNCEKEWRVPFYSEPLTNVKYWWNLPEAGEG